MMAAAATTASSTAAAAPSWHSPSLRESRGGEAVMAAARVTPLSTVAEAFEELDRLLVDHRGDAVDLRLEPFTSACSLVAVLFDSLGLAFKFAEIEYVAKVKDLSDASKTYYTLNNILDHDVKHNTVRKQGSHSRNLRRVRLGLDLIKVLFELFLTGSGCSLREAASTAYEQVCAPFHTWAIRKAVWFGMCTLPSREQLILRLNETDHTVQREMRRYIDASGPIMQYIDNLFHSRNIALNW